MRKYHRPTPRPRIDPDEFWPLAQTVSREALTIVEACEEVKSRISPLDLATVLLVGAGIARSDQWLEQQWRSKKRKRGGRPARQVKGITPPELRAIAVEIDRRKRAGATWRDIERATAADFFPAGIPKETAKRWRRWLLNGDLDTEKYLPGSNTPGREFMHSPKGNMDALLEETG